MKIDPREMQIGDVVYTLNKSEILKIEIREFWQKVNMVAQPLCFLDYYTTEEEVKEILKKELHDKLDRLNNDSK